MKTCYYFFVAAFVAAFLGGCGSSSTPSKDDVEKAVRSYVGMTRPEAGDVKVDEFKILKEEQKKMGDDDVFLRQFEAKYTATVGNNPSKHTFDGTIALVQQGGQWSVRKELCQLTFVESPPIIDAASQATVDQQQKQIREERAKQQGNQ